MPTLVFNAFYLDGKSARKRSLQAKFSDNGVRIEELNEIWPYNKLEIEVVRNDEIYVFSDPSRLRRLEIHDSAAIRYLLNGTRKKFVDYQARVYLKIFISLIFLVVIGLTVFIYSPHLSRFVARQIPVETEIKIRPIIRSEFKEMICENPAATAPLKKMLDFININSTDSYPAEIWYGSSRVVNAFAFPGGGILIAKGLIDKVKNQEELLGVIGHELAHLKSRHVIAALVRMSLLTVAWQTALGDFSSISTVDPSTLYQIASRKFSRDDEIEADLKGAEMLVKSDVSIAPFIQFLENELGKGLKKEFEFISTHPLENRGKRIKDTLKDVPTKKLPLTDKEWKDFKRTSCYL